jgi:hypothetical protein
VWGEAFLKQERVCYDEKINEKYIDKSAMLLTFKDHGKLRLLDAEISDKIKLL